MSKIILDLCGGSGAWSKPYADHGYDVHIIDPWAHGPSVLDYHPPANVHGILAAPPCTDFCSSGAQYWGRKDRDGRTEYSVSVVLACLRIVTETSNLQWWAMENPIGRLPRYIGKPNFMFDPCDYGDPWTKRTCLWGNFTIPKRKYCLPTINHSHTPDKTQGSLWRDRSVTPSGFASAFFKANR